MLSDHLLEGLTFDDVLLRPARSAVTPAEVETGSLFTRNVSLRIPIASSAMDTVTESALAIALAREGGIGIVHKNMSIDRQAEEVDRVKRSESGMIVDPVTVRPNQKIYEAQEIMQRFKISGVPVVDEYNRLVGILTNRDLRFENRVDIPISEVMTKDPLFTVAVGTTLEEAQTELHKHRVEKLLVVDENFTLKGLITVKDIQKKVKYPNAAKDEKGRLRVGAAIGATGDFLERARELVERKVDVLVIDTAHGHSEQRAAGRGGGEARAADGGRGRRQRRDFRRRARLDRARRGRRQGRHGPGFDLHHTRGVGLRRAADHGHRRMRPGDARHGRSADRRRRHQILGRHHQGDRRGRRRGHDRQPLCRHGREPRRDDSLPGPHLQGVPRHGVAGRDGARQRRPLRAGRA